MQVREFIYFIGSAAGFSKLANSNSMEHIFSFFKLPFRTDKQFNNNFYKWYREEKGNLVFFISFIMLFVVNLVWASINGRLSYSQIDNLYNFIDDIPNLINYLIICPAHITIGVFFMNKILHLKDNTKKTGLYKVLRMNAKYDTTFNAKSMLLIALIFLISLIAISYYSNELRGYDHAFWFETLTKSKEKIFSSHGYYYLITNLMLNSMAILVIVAHFEFFYFSSQIGRQLKSYLKPDGNEGIRNVINKNDLLKRENLVKYFKPFISLYAVSKVLIILYMINMYTWKAQDPKFNGMLEFTILLISFLGVILISYPRYHIQYWLYKLWNQNGKNEYPEIRSSFYIGFSNTADYLILGSFMFNLVLYVMNKLGLEIQGIIP